MWNTKCEGYPFRLLSSGTFRSEAAIQSILSGNFCEKLVSRAASFIGKWM
ncbi:hypothetical protein LguiA_035858 [Lonicera macranthoides]